MPLSSLLRPFRGRASARPDRPTPDPAPANAAAITFTGWREQVRLNYEPLANTFDAYRRLVAGLETMDGTRVVPMHEIAEATASPDRTVALRHDVDADPDTGLRMARHLASRGVAGSFYLLHTAPYYGRFVERDFVRNPELADWVRGMIVAGCEIGVHNDALGAELTAGVNGPAALVAEIEWLRSQGAVIRGTVAHNSAPAYGAANSEVFAGRRLGRWSGSAEDGRRLPLESVREDEHGLAYEGTFAVPRPDVDAGEAERFVRDRAGAGLRSEAWMRRFLLDNPTCLWDVDLQVWVVGRDEWVVAGRPGGTPVFRWCVDLDEALDAIRATRPGSRSMVVLHPEYFMR